MPRKSFISSALVLCIFLLASCSTPISTREQGG